MPTVPCAIGVNGYAISAGLCPAVSDNTIAELFTSKEESIVPQNTLGL